MNMYAVSAEQVVERLRHDKADLDRFGRYGQFDHNLRVVADAIRWLEADAHSAARPLVVEVPLDEHHNPGTPLVGFELGGFCITRSVPYSDLPGAPAAGEALAYGIADALLHLRDTVASAFDHGHAAAAETLQDRGTGTSSGVPLLHEAPVVARAA